jgi:hypothetical protein
MLCMGGFMSELNQVLASAHRETLEDFAYFLEQAHRNLSHITEIVGTGLPHIYGYTDACRTGMGGVILPATRWIQPLVWRTKFPDDVIALFDAGKLSVNDLELAANFTAKRIAEHMLQGQIAGLNSWFGSDNTATVSWKTKKAGLILPCKCCEPKPCCSATPIVVPRTLRTLKAQQISSGTSRPDHSMQGGMQPGRRRCVHA